MEYTYTKRYQDCLRLFIKHGGRNLSLIEREMRELGHADFARRILYSRTERGTRKPGWIEKYEWRSLSANDVDNSRRNAGSQPALAVNPQSEPAGSRRSGRTPGPRSDASFQAWLKSVSPDMTWDWKHQQYIYKHLQRVTDGECKRLMIFLPPRHGKSELVTVRYAGWRLRQEPKMRIILASYNQRLADKFSRTVRKILSEEEDTLNAQKAEPPASAGGRDSSINNVVTMKSEAAAVTSSVSNDVEPTVRTATPAHAGGSASFCQPAADENPVQASTPPASQPQRMFPKTRTINTVSEWETAAGGGVKAVGVGAGVTGFGGQLIVIDDPVKSRAEAESETYRDKLWNWYNNDLYTRLEPGGSVILIQTRWHEDDLAGRLLREMQDGGDKWDVINLPALAENNEAPERGQSARTDAPAFATAVDNVTFGKEEERAGSPRSGNEGSGRQRSGDELGRAPGAALCPDRFDEGKLADIQRQLGTYSFSALYQQRPSPADGGIFKRQWFKRFVDKAPDGLQWKRGYDLAVSLNTKACYTASFRVAYDADGNLYIADGFRQRIEFPEQRRYIISRIKLEKDTEHGIERALHGQALLQDLRREARMRGTYLRGVEAVADKLTRALKWAPLAEEGKIIIVKGAWNKEFLEEVCLFPTGKYDDQIDAVSMAVAMYGVRNRKAWGF